MLSKAFLRLLGYYQAWSALRRPRCRYIPTCSHYAQEAVEVHGLTRGLWLATKRIARCNPFGGYGIDEVPEPDNAQHTESSDRAAYADVGHTTPAR